MSPDDLKDLIILSRQIAWNQRLEDYATDEVKQIQKGIKGAKRNVLKHIERRGKEIGPWTKKRAEKLIKEFDLATVGIQQQLGENIAAVATSAGIESFKKHNDIVSFGGRVAKFNATRIAPEQLKSLIQKTPVGGAKLSDWVKRTFSYELQDQIKAEVASGMFEGKGYPALVRRVEKGLDNITRREAITLTRTYVQSVNVGAMESVYRQNPDIVKGVRWSATMEMGYTSTGRGTCERCAVLDGEIYSMDEEHPPCPLHAR